MRKKLAKTISTTIETALLVILYPIKSIKFVIEKIKARYIILRPGNIKPVTE